MYSRCLIPVNLQTEYLVVLVWMQSFWCCLLYANDQKHDDHYVRAIWYHSSGVDLLWSVPQEYNLKQYN
jgi:hypothetical protein